MRTIFLLILTSILSGIVIGLGLLFASRTLAPWSITDEMPMIIANDAARAQIEVGEETYNFGIAEQGSRGTHTFEITNKGNAPLNLHMGHKSCSCTEVKLSHTQLAPGERGAVTLHWNGENKSGAFRESAVILTNDSNKSGVIFRIEGIFSAPLIAYPNEILLGDIRSSETRTAQVRLYAFDEKPLEILATHSSDARCELTWSRGELNENDDNDTLRQRAKSVLVGTLTIPAAMPLGGFLQVFTLETNSALMPKMTLIARGKIVNDWVSIAGVGYSRDEGTWRLGKTTTGRVLRGDCKIFFTNLAATKAALSLREVTPSWLRVNISEPLDAGSRRIFTLTVEVPADAPLGNWMHNDTAAIISLDTQISEVPALRIPVCFAVEN